MQARKSKTCKKVTVESMAEKWGEGGNNAPARQTLCSAGGDLHK